MKKVRWGLLSTANINRHLIPAIRASQRGELMAVASRTQERAVEYARQWDIPTTFGSYEELITSGAVDAVYISLPNHLHATWTVHALRNGMNVLCEKPFALSLKEVDDVIETAVQTGKVVTEAFMYRHHPQTKVVGQWINEGRLGDVRFVRGVFNFKLTAPENVRLVAEYGGGCLWDIGVYPLSFAQYIFGGPPQRVSAFQSIGPSGVDDMFVGQMEYAGERLAQMTCSFRTPAYTATDILGTEGRLHLSHPFVGVENGVVTFYPEEGEPEIVAVTPQPLYLGEVEDMHAAILDGAEPLISLQQTRNHVHTALALYAAARAGQIVTL